MAQRDYHVKIAEMKKLAAAGDSRKAGEIAESIMEGIVRREMVYLRIDSVSADLLLGDPMDPSAATPVSPYALLRRFRDSLQGILGCSPEGVYAGGEYDGIEIKLGPIAVKYRTGWCVVAWPWGRDRFGSFGSFGTHREANGALLLGTEPEERGDEAPASEVALLWQAEGLDAFHEAIVEHWDELSTDGLVYSDGCIAARDQNTLLGFLDDLSTLIDESED